MTEEQHPQNQLDDLQNQLQRKDEEIIKLLDKIEELEDEIIRYEKVVDDIPSKKGSIKAKQSKFEIELEAKDREIRELKNRLGFLRKEKIDVQKELEELKLKNASNSINVEEIREKNKPPLNVLLQELQDKINKQEAIIRTYTYQKSGMNDFEIQIREKDEIIKTLEKKLGEASKLIENTEPKSTKEDKSAFRSFQNEILTDLQDKLNKTKLKNEELIKRLEKYERKDKGGFASEIKNLKEKVDFLTDQLEQKIKLIEHLEEKNSMLDTISGEKSIDGIIEDLQNKLNKARAQIITLQDQFKAVTNQSNNDDDSGDYNAQLKIQREMAIFLQKQLNDSNKALKTKEEEIATIKNEAIRIKRKYEDLENLIKQKENTISSIQSELALYKIKSPIQPINKQGIDSTMELRIKELESLVEDLTKQNIQQRIEMSELRKK